MTPFLNEKEIFVTKPKRIFSENKSKPQFHRLIHSVEHLAQLNTYLFFLFFEPML